MINSSFAGHGAYQESNIDWLDEIPTHWEVKRVKEIGQLVLGKMLDNTPGEGKFYRYYLKSKNIGWLAVNTSSVEQMYFTHAEMKSYRLQKGDLLLSEGGEVGKTSFWEKELDECYIQNSVHKITVSKKNDPRYFLYQSFVLGHIKYYDSIVNQVSIKHLTKEKLSRIFWLCPPLTEQQAIASYLDTQTAHIDRKIDLLTQKASKYHELKQTLINETVTRGLDKTTPTKPSGIDWLGQIPAHWELKRLKDIANVRPSSPTPNTLTDNDFVEFVPMANINEGLGKIEKYDLVPLQHVASGYTRFQNGDVIFAKITPCMENGNCAIVSGLKNNIGFGSTEFFMFRPYRYLTPAYLHYFLRNELFRKNAEPFMKGTAGQKRISSLHMFTHVVPLPPISEQNAITDYLDIKSAHIDRIITTINHQIEKLQELHKTLIDAVVTGRIKVSQP